MPNRNFMRNLGVPQSEDEHPRPRQQAVVDESMDSILNGGASVPDEEDDEVFGGEDEVATTGPASQRLSRVAEQVQTGIYGDLGKQDGDGQEEQDGLLSQGGPVVPGGLGDLPPLPDLTGMTGQTAEGTQVTSEVGQDEEPHYEPLEVPEIPSRGRGGRVPQNEVPYRQAANEAIDRAKESVARFERATKRQKPKLYAYAQAAIQEAKQAIDAVVEVMNGGERMNDLGEKEEGVVAPADVPATVSHITPGYQESVPDQVLEYVCKRTIEHLMSTYESQIYTKQFMSEIMQSYINDEVDSTDPLFKRLVEECIQQAEDDPYLGELTKVVLSWIGEH